MSLKQLIISAIIKVSEENPLLNHADAKTAIESRDQFIQLLMNELFPEAELETTHITVPVVPVPAPAPPTEVPATEAPTPTKKRGPMTEEAKAAMKAKKAANAAKKAETPVPIVPVPVEAPVVVAPVVVAPAKEKKPRAKKAVPENANLAKIDPTWRKHLKAADKEHAKELEPELLKYVNSLTNEEFHAKTTEAHVTDFVASRSDGKVPTDVVPVEFEGKNYIVNPETKRVYECEGVYDEATQEWTNYKPVGYVGMAAFAEMKME